MSAGAIPRGIHADTDDIRSTVAALVAAADSLTGGWLGLAGAPSAVGDNGSRSFVEPLAANWPTAIAPADIPGLAMRATQRVVITTGSNGFIVSARPMGSSDKLAPM